MEGTVQDLLAELRVGLTRIYGDELVGVYLFGSYARGESRPDSDVDVLIVLRDLEGYGSHVDRTGELVCDLSLRYDVSVSRVFVSARDWEEKDSPFLANVREEAIAA